MLASVRPVPVVRLHVLVVPGRVVRTGAFTITTSPYTGAFTTTTCTVGAMSPHATGQDGLGGQLQPERQGRGAPCVVGPD